MRDLATLAGRRTGVPREACWAIYPRVVWPPGVPGHIYQEVPLPPYPGRLSSQQDSFSSLIPREALFPAGLLFLQPTVKRVKEASQDPLSCQKVLKVVYRETYIPGYTPGYTFRDTKDSLYTRVHLSDIKDSYSHPGTPFGH